MNTRRKRGRPLYLWLVGLAAMMLVGALMSLQSLGSPLDVAIRSTALLGYVGLFLAIMASAYMRQMLSLFGKPFVRVHHIAAFTSLVLITLHPLGLAMRSALNGLNLAVFVPDFSSWSAFLRFGGRPAWFLVIAAALAARFRGYIRPGWRAIHILNYVAFLLITVHGLMIGTDTQGLVVRIVMIAMALAVTAAFVAKRLRRRGR
ncbi:MAG: ferric reductase [Anaerolineales bacterium]